MKITKYKPSVLVVALLLLGASPSIASTPEAPKSRSAFAWTGSGGVSYPLVLSVSSGINAPISGGRPFEAVAVQANIDVGVGGGMASAGIYVPTSTDGRVTLNAIVVKAAVLRTWMTDVGVERDRTYRGVVVEKVEAAAGMAAKGGLGYFRSSQATPSADHGFLYLYFGFGI